MIRSVSAGDRTMTGYTVHTGSNQKFTAGWDHIFQGVSSNKKSASSISAGKKKVAAPPKAAKKKGTSQGVAIKKAKRTR
jgi:hypothetical protein